MSLLEDFSFPNFHRTATDSQATCTAPGIVVTASWSEGKGVQVLEGGDQSFSTANGEV